MRPLALLPNLLLAALLTCASRGLLLGTLLLLAALASREPVLAAACALPALVLCAAGARARGGGPPALRGGLPALRAELAAAACAAAVAGLVGWESSAPPAAWSGGWPDLGLWRYLAASVSAREAHYHGALAAAAALAYTLPLTARFGSSAPRVALAASLAAAVTLDASAQASLARAPLAAALALAAAPEAAAAMRPAPTLAAAALAAMALLSAPAMQHAWLTTGAGNINHLFNTQLLWALGCGALMVEFASAELRRERGARRGKGSGG